MNWAPVLQTIRITVRLRATGQKTDYNIVLAVSQVRRIRFLGVPTFVSSQGAVRYDFVYECQ